jgi:hypothetical protein
MLCRVALVRTDVSEEFSVSIIRVIRIGELGTLAVTSNRRTLRRNTECHSLQTGATRDNIPEDAILHCHRRENLKYYTISVTQQIPPEPIIFITLQQISFGLCPEQIECNQYPTICPLIPF